MINTEDNLTKINDIMVNFKPLDIYNELMSLKEILYKLVEENNELRNENILLKQRADGCSKINKIKGNWCVYKHTNKINGKIYIGITSASTLNQRWDNGNGYKENDDFFSDIKKYGWVDGFYHTVIEDGITKEEADNLEKKLIRKYKTQNKNYGYNTEEGGTSCANNAIKVRQYDLNWNFIREYSSISEVEKMNKGIYCHYIRACCRGERESTGGYKWKFVDESLITERRKTNKDNEVFQYSLDGNFITSYENAIKASENTNIKSVLIHRSCQGITTSAGGFQWFYEFKGDNIEPSKIYNDTYRKKTPVNMFDKNMNFIKYYESIQDVIQDLRNIYNVKNAQEGNIRNNLKGRNKTAYGFVFKYANNTN